MASINFKGKNIIWNHHLSVPYHTLEEDKTLSYKAEKAGSNLLIEGDNLLALKSLLPKYTGKIKCIYIDPPYNTGNEGWTYNDKVNSPLIKEWLHKEVGKDDLTRHDKWLCMMTPRIKLLRELLTDDGAIFISIDDNEQHHLRQIMDEIFGEENFRAQITWEKKYSVNNNQLGIAPTTEFILVYSKTGAFKNGLLPRTKESIDRYKNPDNDPRGPWKPVDYWAPTSPEERPNLSYDIVNPNTGLSIKPTKKSWKYSPEVYNQHVAESRIWWGADGKSTVPALKLFLSDVKNGLIPSNLWLSSEVGHTDESAKELQNLFDNKVVFDTPKPTRLIRRILQIATEKNSIVLDSFAGSGTTAHAVLAQNKEDVGNRKFILVQMTESSTKEPDKNVCRDITRARIQKAIEKHQLSGGFSYLRVGVAMDAESMLSGRLPTFRELAKYVYYLASSKTLEKEKEINESTYQVGTYSEGAVYLIYHQNMDKLTKLALTLEIAQAINKAHPKGKKVVYAPACYLDEDYLDEHNIQFVSIPYNLFDRVQ